MLHYNPGGCFVMHDDATSTDEATTAENGGYELDTTLRHGGNRLFTVLFYFNGERRATLCRRSQPPYHMICIDVRHRGQFALAAGFFGGSVAVVRRAVD
jgi:hypothetical protein